MRCNAGRDSSRARGSSHPSGTATRSLPPGATWKASMKKKTIILALAVSAAVLALPAVASAGTWHADPSASSTGFTANTAGHGHTLVVGPSRTTTCTSSTGTGSINVGGTTGGISLKYHGCTSLGFSCNTPGQAAGTLVTSPNLVVHNILIAKGTPGIKITGAGATTQIMHYTCAGGLVTINVTGTVIGHLEQACNTKANTFSLNFEAPGGVQKFMQETGAGTKTDLTFTTNGSPETAGLSGTDTLSFNPGVDRTILCT
jgi:hypothetical protein